MLRVVICAGKRAEGYRLRDLIDSYAASKGIANIEVLVLNSREEFGALLAKLRPNFFNLAICRMDGRCSDMTRAEISEATAGMHALAPQTQFVFMSSDEENALCAYSAGGQFIQLPLQQEDFERVVGKSLLDTQRAQRHMFAVKSGKTVVNLNLDEVTFVEAGKKGPIIHLPGNTVLVSRTTLQALHSLLYEASPAFMKVGGSFIVNLENMRSTSDSSAVFCDGETIILPIRLRKSVSEALLDYRLR